jgi:hypothetical protein
MEGSEIGKKIVFGIILFFLINFLISSVSNIASIQQEIEISNPSKNR